MFSNIKLGKEKISVDDIVIFTEQFSAMVDAGLPVLRCLHTLNKQIENPALKKVIYRICLDLEGGSKLSDSLAKYPHVFSDFYVNMVRTGEAGGMLAEILQEVAEYQQKEQVLKRSVKKAFMYPIIVLCAVAVVATFLVMVIVPVFAESYSKMGLTLPMPTIVLICISKFMTRFGWVIPILAGILVFCYRKVYASSKGRLVIDRFKLNLPIIGVLNRKVAVSRFIRSFGYLFSSGVPVMEALIVSKRITGNYAINVVISTLQQGVKEGKKIAEILAQEELFPPMVTQMVAAGEEAGALDRMLRKSADFLDKDIDYIIDKLVVRIEPVLTLFLAFVVGFIAMAIYLPMFDLITTTGG